MATYNGVERQKACKKLIGDNDQRVDITGGFSFAMLLFGGNIVLSSYSPAALGEGLFFLHCTRNTKICQHQTAIILMNEQVRRFDIPVHNLPWMCMNSVDGVRQVIKITLCQGNREGL